MAGALKMFVIGPTSSRESCIMGMKGELAILAPVFGQEVRIKTSHDAKEFYHSRVIDLTESYVYIELPLHQRDHRPSRETIGRQVWVEFKARDGSLCKYSTVIVDVIDMPMTTWKLHVPNDSSLEREQRREFVRVPADLPVAIQIPQVSGVLRENVYSRDISGGGMAILIPRSVIVHPGETIHVTFTLPNNRYVVESECFVVRVSDRNEQGYASASLRYLEMKESVRQRIIQFCFNRQRSLR